LGEHIKHTDADEKFGHAILRGMFGVKHVLSIGR